MNISLFKKILLTSSVLGFIASPLVSFAQNNTQQQPPRAIIVDQNQTYQPATLQDSQAYYQNNNSRGTNWSAGSAAGSISKCIFGSGVSGLIKTYVTSLVGSLSTALTAEVPTADNSLRAKDTGVLGVISWDQVGYCAVNGIIESIGAATVAWINGGFQGNPVFVDNPEQFFADIADQQAGAFLNELSNGFLCSPIQSVVRVNLAQNYNNSVAPYGQQCSFSGSTENMKQFMSGDSFSWAEWNSYTQTPQNNPFGATIGGQIELDRRIAQSLGIQSNLLDWGGGFLSSRDPQTGKITSPGSVIEKQVNERLGSGQRRLEMADEFDEIVNALVNQLVLVAINKMTESSQ